MHEACRCRGRGRARSLEQESVVGLAGLELRAGDERLLAHLAALRLREERVDSLDRGRRDRGLVLVADGLDHAGGDELRPHLPEQRVRWIDIGAVERAVDREREADDVVVAFTRRLQRIEIALLRGHQLLVLERELQARRRLRCAHRRADIAAQPRLRFADIVPHSPLPHAGLRCIGVAGEPRGVGIGRSRHRRLHRELQLAGGDGGRRGREAR